MRSTPCAKACAVKRYGWWERIGFGIPMICPPILTQRTTYYAALQQPESAEDFIAGVRKPWRMLSLASMMGSQKSESHPAHARKNRIKLSPLDPQPEPANISA